MEICAKEYKAEEKSQKNKRIILMWDPDLIFDTSKIISRNMWEKGF